VDDIVNVENFYNIKVQEGSISHHPPSNRVELDNYVEDMEFMGFVGHQI
jgi:hypothetical protein